MRVAVPVEEAPPVTLVGLRLSAASVGGAPGGLTVRTAECDAPREPVIVTGVEAVTDVVVTVNVVLVEPTGTVTLAGTEATAGLLLERETTAQQADTAPLRVTVPVEESPPVTVVGLSVSDESCGPGGAGFTLIVVNLLIPPDEAVI